MFGQPDFSCARQALPHATSGALSAPHARELFVTLMLVRGLLSGASV